MVSKVVKYKNFKGVEVERELLFNLTKPETVDLESSVDGGLSAQMDVISKTKDATKVVGIFKKILSVSYGELSGDGEVFMKSPEITKKFECSAAYEAVYMDFLLHPEKAADFYNELAPKYTEEELKQLEFLKDKIENEQHTK